MEMDMDLDADRGFLEQWEEEAMVNDEVRDWLISEIYGNPEVFDAIR
jgi:hypothetical protein